MRAGQIYIAPGGRHMRVVRRRGGEATIAIDDGPMVNFCKPSVDPLFAPRPRSGARKCLAVVAHRHGLATATNGGGRDRRRRRQR